MPSRLAHLTTIDSLNPSLANELLDSADEFLELTRQPIVKLADLRGKTIINVFYEASTRTRTSFELAGKRLGADVVNIGGSATSSSKGETLRDTVKTLDAMHADAIVIRHPASGASDYVAKHTRAAVINAGDGMHEHPTQALLDALTIRRHRGKDFRGLTIAILGDVLHSRVARSNAKLLKMLGANVRLAGPRTLLPRDAALTDSMLASLRRRGVERCVVWADEDAEEIDPAQLARERELRMQRLERLFRHSGDDAGGEHLLRALRAYRHKDLA